jgi:hypothetical protein
MRLQTEYCDAYPLLGNRLINTFPLKYAATIGRPLLRIGCHASSTLEDVRCWAMDVFPGWSVSKCYGRQRRAFAISRRAKSRMEGDLGGQGIRVRPKIDCG